MTWIKNVIALKLGRCPEATRGMAQVHGILNGISWGILMPVGAIIARYLKAYEVNNMGLGATWPKKDHKYRIFWNMFHYVIGYGTIGLGIWNVFKGIDIMEERRWKSLYVGMVIGFALFAFVCELVTWILLCLKKVNNHDEDQLDDVVDQRIP
ncbi:hypothetical protein PIB30_050087 [Stylosanthes scabra]|uniref:Cytochrome b561 and DOMON domain-containing protein n=1 Tax=Stylosanthes scabra TaxID=79078 RepID=A0ABU6XFB6_9FABA|nr:hypothetical protein [Stylosanthes scabra]